MSIGGGGAPCGRYDPYPGFTLAQVGALCGTVQRASAALARLRSRLGFAAWYRAMDDLLSLAAPFERPAARLLALQLLQAAVQAAEQPFWARIAPP
jgi:hypothetical protein